jgi:putative ABC transport system permease protein
VFGLALVQGGVALAGPWLQAQYGVVLSAGWPSAAEWTLLGGVMLAALVASLVPALLAYRRSLADGMTIRI